MPTPALYQLAQSFHQLEPWETWEETDVLKIIHPVTGDHAYISIMGQLGEHRAIALYLGDASISRFYTMQSDDPSDPLHHEEDTISLIMETRQLQLSFGTRDELRADQLKHIKQLGFKFRGDNWPIFRSYEAGYGPGDLSEEEISWLTVALEQFIAFFNAHEQKVPEIFREKDGVPEILTRRCHEGQWLQEWQEDSLTEFHWPTPEPSELLIEKIQLSPTPLTIECHFFQLPALIGDKKKPRLGYLALSADAHSGMILGAEILSVEKQSFPQMIASVPNVFLNQWIKAGVRPAALRVKTINSYSLLEITAADLNIEIKRQNKLPALDRAIRQMPF